MVGNTSATGGYLLPIDPLPLCPPSYCDPYDEVFFEGMNNLLAGITGIDSTLVQQGWQFTSPTVMENAPSRKPGKYINKLGWIINSITSPQNPGLEEDESGEFILLTTRDTIQISCEFLGDKSTFYAVRLRDGLSIEQNRIEIEKLGFDIGTTTEITHEPDLYNTNWYQKAYIGLEFSRTWQRKYSVLSFIDAQVENILED